MSWYPYPISFLDWYDDMCRKRREKKTTAAKCRDSWPDIAWSGNAEQEHGDVAEQERNEASSSTDFVTESERPAIGEASSAGGADEDGERRGVAEMTPALPRKSSKRVSQTFVTAVPVAAGLNEDTNNTNNDDGKRKAKLKAARSNDTFATALMGGGGEAATLRGALSTETFATAREFNTLTMSRSQMSLAGIEEVQGGSGSVEKGTEPRRESKVTLGEERMVGCEDAVTDGDAARRSAASAHHWPSGRTRHL